MLTKLRRTRKMTYVVWAWCLLILAWAIAGGTSAASKCNAEGAYTSACQAGAGIGVALILFIGFIGFVFFSIIWFMTRPKDK